MAGPQWEDEEGTRDRSRQDGIGAQREALGRQARTESEPIVSGRC